jgi:hypothetical protein
VRPEQQRGKFMSEIQIVASNLAAAIISHPTGRELLATAKNCPEAAAKLFFECLDALVAENEKRPAGNAVASFGHY